MFLRDLLSVAINCLPIKFEEKEGIVVFETYERNEGKSDQQGKEFLVKRNHFKISKESILD